MKVCPVCGARAFDDARKCFGCLFDFNEADAAVFEAADPVVAEGAVPTGSVIAAETNAAAARGSAPPFLIRFTPTAEPSGGIAWRCAVEMG